VQRTLIRPPSSRLGPLEDKERRAVMNDSPVHGIYDEGEDRISAYETLKKRAEMKAGQEERQREQETKADTKKRGAFTIPEMPRSRTSKRTTTRRRSSRRQSTTEALVKSVARSAGSALGRAIIRGVLGSLKKGF
jgi:hypothetical protein